MNREAKAALAIIAICAALLVLLTVLLPVSSQEHENFPESQTVIELVYPYQNSQWTACIEEVISSFEDKHPHIDVQYEILYEDRVYEDILSKKAARNELGDIVQLKEPYIWAESGLISSLPDRFSESVSFVCSVDGETYAVCALGSTTGIVYNKAIFEDLGLKPPESYQEFLGICRKLRSSGLSPLGVGGEDLWHLEYWLNHFLRSDVLSKEPDFLALCSAGEKDWSDPLITEMLVHMKELFSLGYVHEDWLSTPDGSLAYMMADGEIAMVFSGPWLASSALSLAPWLELGWFYVPNCSGETVAGESMDVFWAVTSDCAGDPERYEAAIVFLDHFYSQDVYEKLCMDMGSFSTLSDTSRDATPSDGILAEVMEINDMADMHISAYVGDENTPPGFEKKLLLLLHDMCSGALSVEETQNLCCQYWMECLLLEAEYE